MQVQSALPKRPVEQVAPFGVGLVTEIALPAPSTPQGLATVDLTSQNTINGDITTTDSDAVHD